MTGWGQGVGVQKLQLGGGQGVMVETLQLGGD